MCSPSADGRCGRPISVASFSRNLVQLPPTQGIEQIPREDDALALPPRESLLDEVIDTPVHRLAHFGGESTAAGYGLPRKKLTIEPSGAARRDLRLKIKIRTRRKRKPLSSVRILIGARLDDRPGPRVASHLEIGELQMMGSAIDPSTIA